jgi:RNA polymerase sigma-70 factor (ECF subfamily)
MTEFHALYERYAPLVRRFALLLCGDPWLADDITSETFVRAWTTPGPVRQETVKAYLFTIVRNLYRDSLRQTRRHTALSETLPDKHARARDQAGIRSELQLVLAAMQKLPEVDRAALLMRAREGMSYEEIAQALGLSLASVKVKIHRARLKLMQLTRVQNQNPHKSEDRS